MLTGKREGHWETCTIDITAVAEPYWEGNPASSASASASADNNGSGGSPIVRTIVHDNPLKSNGKTSADATDEELLPLGLPEKEGVNEARTPRLSTGRIRELAGDDLDAAAMELEETGDVDRAALERRLREKLAAEGVPLASIVIEFDRVVEALAAF